MARWRWREVFVGGGGVLRKLIGTVVVLTLTRIIKSVVTGQAPVSLEWKNTPGNKCSKAKLVCTRTYCTW